MIQALFDKHSLEGAPNFRDLGGLPAADGRHIKPARLLRCGHLHDITAADGEKLVNDYGLKTVIDLRTTNEMARRPDTLLPEVTYIHCPIFEQKAEGVTRETVVAGDTVDRAMAMAEKMEGNAHERMKSLYATFFAPEGIEHYREFFNILLQQDTGSVLWHCTMGKDRCGTAAMLVETALGVPAPLVLEDYLYTNERLALRTADIIREALRRGAAPSLMNQFRIMDGVHPEFLQVIYDTAEAISGSVEAFLREQLDMTEEKLTRLRAMYLE